MTLKNKKAKKKVLKKEKDSDLYKQLNTVSFKLSLEKLNTFYSSKKSS